MAEAKIAGLFDTPLIADRIDDAALLAELKRLILARREADRGIEASNLGGWHSTRDMADWGGESARAVADRVIGLAERCTIDVGAKPGRERYRWRAEMWANVSPPGASNAAHAHPGCYWSAVLYVDAGDKDAGGEFVLSDPRLPMLRMHAPDLRFRRPGRQEEQDEIAIVPETGLLLMFPAWLMHSVRPYRGQGLRISVAVNLSAVPAG